MATATTYLDNSPSAGPIYRHGNSDILPAWSQREAAAAEQPWTATRCHRQLRPLLTHLMALRREKARAALKRTRESEIRHPLSPSKRSTATTDDDPAGRKRVRYTYSLKGRRRRGRPSTTPDPSIDETEKEHNTPRTKVAPLLQQAKRSFYPGEVVIATPVLSRARKHGQEWSLPSSPLMHRESEPADGAASHDQDQVTSRQRPRNPHFRYRGYYQDPLRLAAAGNTAKPASSPCMDAEWAALLKSTAPECRQMYEAIFRATEVLLRTTACRGMEPARKSGSLLAMCLRKVPQYVAACEDAAREDAEKDGAVRLPSSDVSLGIYSDLESLGSSRSGWKHLRIFVRQHGIDILKAACVEGLLHDTFVRLLIRLCTHMKAFDEAEGLMTALFDNHISSLAKGLPLFEKPDETNKNSLSESDGPLASLSILLQYAEETGRTSVPLQQITKLVNQGHLPSAWLSTAVFGSLWHRTVRLLSSRSSPVCDEDILLDFTATAAAHLVVSRPDDDIFNTHSREQQQGGSSTSTSSSSSLTLSTSFQTLVSVLGSICAVGILQREAMSETSNVERLFKQQPAVHRRLSVLVQHALTEVTRKIKRRKGQHRLEAATHCFPRQYLLGLVVRLVQADFDSCGGRPNLACEAAFQQLVENTSSAQKGQIYDATISLVTCIAECCGRASESVASGVPASRSYLLSLCTQAASLIRNVLDHDSESTLAARLQADAAFLLASRSNDLRDLAFAESLGRTSSQASGQRATSSGSRGWHPSDSASVSNEALLLPPSKARNPPVTALFEGYRWEEGISEWVVSTPRPAAHSRPLDIRSQSPASRRRSELVVVLLDEYHPQQPPKGDISRPLSRRRASTRRGRYSLPASFPPPSPATGDDSDAETFPLVNRNRSSIRTTATPRLPRTPPSTSSSQPRNTRRQKSRQSLLNLISDDESVDLDEIETTTPTRRPLFDLANNVDIARRSVAPGTSKQTRNGAAYRYDAADVTTSDDELGL